MIKRFAHLALLAAIPLTGHGEARAQQAVAVPVPRPPFTATLSNNTPLAFGMNVEETSRAVGQPLQYISGPPGGEIYLALRNLGGSGLINYHHRLFLQFHRGKLAGWKEDYGRNWMWQ